MANYGKVICVGETLAPLLHFQIQIDWLVSFELNSKSGGGAIRSYPLLSTEADWMIGNLVEFQLI